MLIHSLTLAAALLGSAEAGDSSNPPRTEIVTYRTSDLASPIARTRLVEDIRSAARAVCREHGRRGLDQARRERACYDRAMEQAMAQVEPQSAEAGRLHAGEAVSAREALH